MRERGEPTTREDVLSVRAVLGGWLSEPPAVAAWFFCFGVELGVRAGLQREREWPERGKRPDWVGALDGMRVGRSAEAGVVRAVLGALYDAWREAPVSS